MGRLIEFESDWPAGGTCTHLDDTLPTPGSLYLDWSITEPFPVVFDSW